MQKTQRKKAKREDSDEEEEDQTPSLQEDAVQEPPQPEINTHTAAGLEPEARNDNQDISEDDL